QPLTAIAANAATGRLLLRRETTDTNEARSVMDDLVDDSDRVRQVLDNFSDLFGKEDQRYQPINMNEITAGALHALRRQLRDRDIATSVEFASQMPIVLGHKGQLQEVLLNLIQNSIEAMDFVEPDARRLKLRTVTGSGRELIVQVEDSGPGIDPKKINTIFNAFVTTKPGGTGLGLALCRRIIERHGGQLTASSDGKTGTLLQVALPI
ncbi:MAG: GHKL domain-containing protein, partial [Acidobacteriaceae bacterium]|nr:GHKL domain-containing protein [Acidobacteriaceae bacterium]